MVQNLLASVTLHWCCNPELKNLLALFFAFMPYVQSEGPAPPPPTHSNCIATHCDCGMPFSTCKLIGEHGICQG